MGGLTYSKIGYSLKIVGAPLILSPLGIYAFKMYKALEVNTGLGMPKLSQSEVLEAAGLIFIGGIYYFVGNLMHSRELEEHKVKLLEDILESRENTQV